ncbi:MAG: hypothetical protein A2479_02095 [Candidatus Magasanikbacteria bacterium RIFOXYC2_FULL_39_8]|nr:MAG: hypothetical protein A2479_02095 [Candidatus Magasanikbacteria bacterium RIFOXYC2_FULL_39_8]
MAMVALCVSVLPMLLLFIGTRETSGTNTSFLLLSELIFTLLFTPFFGEKNDLYKVIGVIGILIGAAFLLFNDGVKINNGDILIILSTITYPVGNFYVKKAFNYIAPGAVLFIRFLLAGLFLCILSLCIEPFHISSIYNNFGHIILFGLIFMGATKIVWYEGFKYLDISKSISLLMTFPLFSLVIILFIGEETISIYQWIGIIVMMIGVYFSIKRKSVNPALTKYAT